MKPTQLSCFWFILPLTFSLTASADYFPIASPGCAGIADLVLIYYGGVHRPYEFTPEDFQPYVSWTDPENGREEWLFDGFLFIEFKNGKNHEYAEGYGYHPARKQEWQWYQDRLFSATTGLAALNQCVASTIDRIGPPKRPRRVVITQPEAIYGQTDWGSLKDSAPLDFHEVDDQVAACHWYLNKLDKRWKEADFEHIEMAGLYWVAERTAENGDVLLPRVSQVIHEHDWKFFWIPYWQAPGAGKWKVLGFDVAYQQPNYFFKTNVPPSRLPQAMAFARRHGMGMEMEWDGRIFKMTETHLPRMDAYLDAFEHSSFNLQGAQAHYEGGGGMIKLSESTDPALRARYLRYCRMIRDRQEIADGGK
jgi:hypothetical protein